MSLPFPVFVYTAVASTHSADDGDVWPLQEGYSVEYDGQKHTFIVRQRGVVLGTLTSKRARAEVGD